MYIISFLVDEIVIKSLLIIKFNNFFNIYISALQYLYFDLFNAFVLCIESILRRR